MAIRSILLLLAHLFLTWLRRSSRMLIKFLRRLKYSRRRRWRYPKHLKRERLSRLQLFLPKSHFFHAQDRLRNIRHTWQHLFLGLPAVSLGRRRVLPTALMGPSSGA